MRFWASKNTGLSITEGWGVEHLNIYWPAKIADVYGVSISR